MSRDISDYHNWGHATGIQQIEARVLLSILQCTRQPPLQGPSGPRGQWCQGWKTQFLVVAKFMTIQEYSLCMERKGFLLKSMLLVYAFWLIMLTLWNSCIVISAIQKCSIWKPKSRLVHNFSLDSVVPGALSQGRWGQHTHCMSISPQSCHRKKPWARILK